MMRSKEYWNEFAILLFTLNSTLPRTPCVLLIKENTKDSTTQKKQALHCTLFALSRDIRCTVVAAGIFAVLCCPKVEPICKITKNIVCFFFFIWRYTYIACWGSENVPTWLQKLNLLLLAAGFDKFASKQAKSEYSLTLPSDRPLSTRKKLKKRSEAEWEGGKLDCFYKIAHGTGS